MHHAPVRRFGHIAALWAGCRCAPTPPPRVSHVPTWPLLVDAAVRGDAASVSQYAEGLTGDDDEGDAGARIGAAMGFLRFAEDRDELADAVVAIAVGCAECHVARAVEAPEPEGSAAVRLVAPVVFGASPDGVATALAGLEPGYDADRGSP